MKKMYLLASMIIITLAGCSNLYTPYEVVEQIDYKGRHTERYEFGITEEKVSALEYIITAQLTSTSTAERANDMIIYHAAILSEKFDFPAFQILEAKQGSWCSSGRSTFRDTLIITNNLQWDAYKQRPGISLMTMDAGPSARIRIAFLTDKEYQAVKSSQRIKHVSKTIANLHSKINMRPSEEEMTLRSRETLQGCIDKQMSSVVAYLN